MKPKKKSKGYEEINITETGRVIYDELEQRTTKKKKKKKEPEIEISLEEKRENNRTKGKFEVEKKRKKKTTGELIRKGKTKGVERKLERMTAKAVAIRETLDIEDEEKSTNLPAMFRSASEQDFFDEFNTMFAATRQILRSLEKKMLDSENGVSSKDVYALCTLYSNMRETIGDMRSIKDMQAQADEIRAVIFEPLASSIAGYLVDFYQKLNRDMIVTVKDPNVLATLQAYLKAGLAETSVKVQDEFKNSASRVVNVLNGG